MGKRGNRGRKGEVGRRKSEIDHFSFAQQKIFTIFCWFLLNTRKIIGTGTHDKRMFISFRDIGSF